MTDKEWMSKAWKSLIKDDVQLYHHGKRLLPHDSRNEKITMSFNQSKGRLAIDVHEDEYDEFLSWCSELGLGITIWENHA